MEKELALALCAQIIMNHGLMFCVPLITSEHSFEGSEIAVPDSLINVQQLLSTMDSLCGRKPQAGLQWIHDDILA